MDKIATKIRASRINVCFVPILRASFLNERFFWAWFMIFHIQTMKLFALKFELTGLHRLFYFFVGRSHYNKIAIVLIVIIRVFFIRNLNAVLNSFLISFAFIFLSFVFDSVLAIYTHSDEISHLYGFRRNYQTGAMRLGIHKLKKKLTFTLKMKRTCKQNQNSKKELKEA